MRLDEFIDGLERDPDAERRRLAAEKSYEILDYMDTAQQSFQNVLQGDSLFGSSAPSIFVGRSNYPRVSTGLLSPMDPDSNAADFATSGDWYKQGLSIDDVFQRRTGLLNSTRSAAVDVNDVWDGFVGVQREVAIAGRPVDVEIGLDNASALDFQPSIDEISTPTGPRARARSADLAENPYIPRPVQKTLEDDDWQAQGAMTYLYRRGFDVYDINKILSAGALGQTASRKLVPTRWSITAVDDTLGQYLRGRIRNAPSIDTVQVWTNEYMGNQFWVILAPGNWEYELVEMKAPGSIWNPDPGGALWMGADSEGYEGRTAYVDETSGAYYASRLGALEYLESIGRQAKCIVLRHVSDDYWGPVGVWQVRESVRNAFDGDHGEAETFHDAVRQVAPLLPVSLNDLRRKSSMVSGIQANLTDFS
ncbi:DNA repair protein NreA [Haladaptatus sp. DJG-WS-42]|uniref:DNA repair protein NreA n=1 Tax=Haladaptatus sp. DJG-WS-42 TaxID=3120516 RepID=UPI0030CB14C9